MRNPPSREDTGALVVPVGRGGGSLYDHRLDMLLLETSSSKRETPSLPNIHPKKKKEKKEKARGSLATRLTQPFR